MVTIKEVAKKAGVSASTVSRVLSGKTFVDADIQRRVNEAVRELNYTPNVLARALKDGKSNTIGLIVADIRNQIVPDVTKGVEAVARKNGFTLILCNTDNDPQVEISYINKLKTRWCDGFISLTGHPDSTHWIDLRRSGFPVVLVCRAMQDQVDAVIIDNYKAGYEAVLYLLKTGHQRIATVIGNFELELYQQRFDGYKQALLDNGFPFLPEYVITEKKGLPGFYRLTKELVEKENRPDAIFAASDPIAMIVMRAIKDCGLQIPNDISVIGVDNIDISQYMDPPLTTISQPLYEMGELATKKLIYMIQNDPFEPPVIDVMPSNFIMRKSTR